MNECRVAHYMERAAALQVQALALVREARDPSAQAIVDRRQRARLLWALERLAHAQRLLRQAQINSKDPPLRTTVGTHLLRLSTVIESVERRLQDMDNANIESRP